MANFMVFAMQPFPIKHIHATKLSASLRGMLLLSMAIRSKKQIGLVLEKLTPMGWGPDLVSRDSI
jgi:hypothetical protein